MNTLLFIHNVGCIVSLLLALWLAPLVYFKNPTKTPNRMLGLALLMVAVFFISHIIGTNLTDGELSRKVLMLNVSVMWFITLNNHCVLSLIGLDQKKRLFIITVYGIALFLTMFYFIFPDTFLLVSEPKMYLPNYYVPGAFHWVMRVIYNLIVPVYFLVQLVIAGLHADPVSKNRYRYFFWSFIFGYGFGSLLVPLVFNVPVDPAWGSLFVLFWAVPFAYAVVQYELLDIVVVAKRAIVFTTLVAASTLMIFLISVSNNMLVTRYPDLPTIIMPLIASIIAVIVGLFIWRRLKDSELLKYEFVNIVTHKFRTPLTKIKWETDHLIHEVALPAGERESVERISVANTHLIELTNLLVNLTDPKTTYLLNKLEQASLVSIAEKIVVQNQRAAERKSIELQFKVHGEIPSVMVNVAHIEFVIHTLVENAILYTPKGVVLVSISSTVNKKSVRFEVRDQGLGLGKEELDHIFERFYRGNRARREYTEGMGIRLHMAQEIIKNHDGKMWAESDGEQQGSRFYFTLPAADEKYAKPAAQKTA